MQIHLLTFGSVCPGMVVQFAPEFSLKQAVRRNNTRFPEDFMFELTKHELTSLRSQIVISPSLSTGYTPFAFTEQGVAMLSSVLRSEKAIEINISIMRAFVTVRSYLIAQSSVSAEIKELWQHVKALEEQSEENLKALNDMGEENQETFDEIYLALSELANKHKNISSPNQSRKPIGFVKPNE